MSSSRCLCVAPRVSPAGTCHRGEPTLHTILPGARGVPEACSTAGWQIHRRSFFSHRSVSADAASPGLGLGALAVGFDQNAVEVTAGTVNLEVAWERRSRAIGAGPFGMMPSARSPRKTNRRLRSSKCENSQAWPPPRRARRLAFGSTLSVKSSVSPRLG